MNDDEAGKKDDDQRVTIKDVVAHADDRDGLPSVSLFVMAKNAEVCLPRLLDNVGPFIQEVVLVLNDTEDETEERVRRWADLNDKPLLLEHVTCDSHPEFYQLDTRETYEVGSSLISNWDYVGPFTELPILADWAAARNTMWGMCTKEWRLFLDADDLVVDPYSIPIIAKMTDDNGADAACSTYQFNFDAKTQKSRGSSMRERLARNTDDIRWLYPIHEVLFGYSKRVMIPNNLVVRDMRDNVGKNVRIPGRNFKILYKIARENDWEVPARILVYLIMEVRHQVSSDPEATMPFAEALLRLFLGRSDWPEERAWALTMVGEMKEMTGKLEEAEWLYLRSLDEHPGAKTAFRLCRVHHARGNWKECVEAYELGLEHAANVHLQTLDDGPIYADMSKILVASALHQMGQDTGARQACLEALKIWPENEPLLELARVLGALS